MKTGFSTALVIILGLLCIINAELDAGDFTTVDLRASVNMGFKDSASGDGKGGWMDSGGNDIWFGSSEAPGKKPILTIILER